ncbi:hypothetical protein QR680_006923 [Steinernema hermaphroditum]|uniref:Uncharacterized protein n=1 Tax=Steinernema hermaphroditum TaxID=289476 RepID=A0AA39LY68_9BILA|nr:hypothetical protein QR680_006923 [Steinernema hermaphroditum]
MSTPNNSDPSQHVKTPTGQPVRPLRWEDSDEYKRFCNALKQIFETKRAPQSKGPAAQANDPDAVQAVQTDDPDAVQAVKASSEDLEDPTGKDPEGLESTEDKQGNAEGQK